MTIKMKNEYLKMDWELLKEDQNDAFGLTDSSDYM